MVHRPTTAEKRRVFRTLHESGCFVMPNPWSAGSARYLEGLGFPAVASTSAGFAHSLGRADGHVTLDDMLAHYRDLVAATDIPVNADFEGGFADSPDAVGRNVTLCVETGVAGLSIEDFTGDESRPLYDVDLAVARVAAARSAIDAAGGEVVLTARSEGFVHGRPDLDETVRRLVAFADAGADCLYAPFLQERDQIVAVVEAVAPKPVNFLSYGPLGHTVADLAALGVRRVSVGATLARVAMDAFIRSARSISSDGTFDSFAGVVGNAELDRFFETGQL